MLHQHEKHKTYNNVEGIFVNLKMLLLAQFSQWKADQLYQMYAQAENSTIIIKKNGLPSVSGISKISVLRIITFPFNLYNGFSGFVDRCGLQSTRRWSKRKTCRDAIPRVFINVSTRASIKKKKNLLQHTLTCMQFYLHFITDYECAKKFFVL